jgi:hypothetical protein
MVGLMLHISQRLSVVGFSFLNVDGEVPEEGERHFVLEVYLVYKNAPG